MDLVFEVGVERLLLLGGVLFGCSCLHEPPLPTASHFQPPAPPKVEQAEPDSNSDRPSEIDDASSTHTVETITAIEFINNRCKKTKTCSLKRISLEIREQASDDGTNEGTSIIGSYETQKVEQLDEYAFVQFIRGCVFSSTNHHDQDSPGPTSRFRTFWGDPLFNLYHPEWVIDSEDTDPMYQSHSSPRHGRYLVTPDLKAPLYFAQNRPSVPILYIVDEPSAARLTRYRVGTTQNAPLLEAAENVSLEFELCLFRTRDIPQQSRGEHSRDELLKSAGPIHCFQWRSSHVFNHESRKFERPKRVVPRCLPARP